jgi:glutamate--cysteine ligase
MDPHMPHSAADPVIEHRQQLLDYFASGEKPAAAWRIGTEHEKFGFNHDDHRPPAYDGERGIRAMLDGLTRYGWEPVLEHGQPIALLREQCSITLEPAGQFELSGAPLENIHQTCAEVTQHLSEVRSVADPLGLGFLGMGFHPESRREDMPWMPKGRYAIMRRYMPTRGQLGLDMMTRTCTVQVNLDYDSEADMIRKFQTSLALQPVATALFADSPFREGKPSGLLSTRAHVWTDTDPDRTGMLPFVFEHGFGYERYLDYILDVPMYFVYRDGEYHDVAGRSFRDFMAGRLPGFEGERPLISDFTSHLTTAFPEVRLKRYLEMRGADGGPWGRLCALPALWVGLLYDPATLAEAHALAMTITSEEREQLRRDVPRLALGAPFRGGTLLDLAKQVVALAAHGLAARGVLNRHGADERIYLEPLLEILDAGQCPAERKLALYHGAWNHSVAPVFETFAY